jgi:hypothetical protein
MPERIDHVIAAAADFAALEAAWVRLGFHVTGGGTHPHLGTRNRIIVLGEGYVELLGIADAQAVSPRLRERLAGPGAAGWVGFAVQTTDIAAEAAAMGGRGADVRGPQPGRLVAPDGRARGWRVATVGDGDLWAAAEPLPFLIQHDTTGEQHRAELAGAGGLAPHANGAQRLRAVTIAVRELAAAARDFARVYALEPSGPARPDAVLDAEMLELPLPASGERIRLARPTGPGIAQRRLDAAGEGVCSLAIGTAERAGTLAFLRGQGIGYDERDGRLLLDQRATLGIPLELIPEA